MVGADEIRDDEWLLRRLPEERGPTEPGARPSHLAFRPGPRDVDGLSLYREQVVSAQELAAWGRVGRTYYVARVRAGAIRGLRMSVLAVPDPAGRPGHVIIPELNASSRKGEVEEAWQFDLAAICAVEGPFYGQVEG